MICRRREIKFGERLAECTRKSFMGRRRVETVCVDTNVVLRFLLGDESNFYKQAEEIFFRAERGEIKIYLDEIIAVEAVWGLIKLNKIKKQEALVTMTKLVTGRYS